MRVFLIHGMGRTPASMAWLAMRLRLQGHQPRFFGYAVTLETLDTIAGRFADVVRSTLESDQAAEQSPPSDDGGGGEDGRGDRLASAGGSAQSWAVIGHSLGNIITRLASPGLPGGFDRFIMLAPPNNPPAIARELQDQPLFQALTRDAGQKICDEDFYEELPMPDVPSLVIAGTRGVEAGWHPLSGRDNDAVVAVDEAFIPGIPMVTIPGAHTFLMNRSDTFNHIRNFLASGEPPEEAQHDLAEANLADTMVSGNGVATDVSSS